MSAPALSLRPARLDDALRLFTWRDDPQARAASAQTGPLDWNAHQAWFAGSLGRRDRILLIGEVEGAAIGVVRFDETGIGVWTIGINLAAEARGRGLGGRLLAAGMERIGAKAFVARVREENLPSRRIFEAAGFTASRVENGFLIYERRARVAA